MTSISRRIHVVALGLISAGLVGTIQAAAEMPLDVERLSFEERVRCQRAIEEVYWRHRIWPDANPAPKPAMDQVLPDTAIRERVATQLQKSAALGILWSRPLTGEQLQNELDRMARRTNNPEVLHELFAVLDNDPFLAAECLARPALTERLTRNWYARDTRFHGELRTQAEVALVAYREAGSRLADLGGEYAEREWPITTERWRDQISLLARSFGVETESADAFEASDLLARIPINRLSSLIENDDAFVVKSVLSTGPEAVRVATVHWRKRSLDHWWMDEGRELVVSMGGEVAISPPPPGYRLPSPRGSGCTIDTWAELSDAPTPRLNHSAVWTGAEMIVWGGYDAYEYFNSGWRYDPAIDHWTATTMAGAPSARYAHAAIWTGTEMIVWGGGNWGGSEEPNEGGSYNPSTSRWTATSTVGAPSGRLFPTGIWTGTEMIVWGGEKIHIQDLPPMIWYVEVDTGGRYDPSSDSWTATPTGPTARSGHTAIWTGREMIVWGGGQVDTGGRYEPFSDSWMETSVENGVPIARSGHTAIWTGSEMIVWGAAGSMTGGRYDPATDGWTATSVSTGVPETRHDHTAVWTGTEMIVWGGRQGDTLHNSGARYDPASDSWSATSTAIGVPMARASHAVVWTGSRMIVWGGDADVGPVNSGGLYCACEGGDVSIWYPDADGDGYGANSTGVPSCTQPTGHLPNAGDCDDLTATCIDDCTTDIDADGVRDCADHCLDADGDLYGAPGGAGFLCHAADCDDTSSACTLDCSDPDEDAVPECRDNCPGVHNPSQTDIDSDGWGGADGCDCTDTNYNVYPGAEEINDGLDNQCPGDEGHGLIDEIGSDCGFHTRDNQDEFSWTAQPRATGYGVARSADPQFAANCHMTESAQTSWVDTDPVPEGTCFHYLVQATSPRTGSWGANSEGVGRTGVCP